MAVKPILFSTEMVRAILDGHKSVTRRVVNHKHLRGLENLTAEKIQRACIAPYRPGDILYVRETWNRGYIESSDIELDNSHWFEEYLKHDGSFLDGISHYFYRADFTRPQEYELGTLDENNVPKPMPWHPSIHMPKAAARIFLRVTDVRAERLQEMCIDDVLHEGVPIVNGFSDFKRLWDRTVNSADRERYGWDANPWVWVIEFDRCEKPEEV